MYRSRCSRGSRCSVGGGLPLRRWGGKGLCTAGGGLTLQRQNRRARQLWVRMQRGWSALRLDRPAQHRSPLKSVFDGSVCRESSFKVLLWMGECVLGRQRWFDLCCVSRCRFLPCVIGFFRAHPSAGLKPNRLPSFLDSLQVLHTGVHCMVEGEAALRWRPCSTPARRGFRGPATEDDQMSSRSAASGFGPPASHVLSRPRHTPRGRLRDTVSGCWRRKGLDQEASTGFRLTSSPLGEGGEDGTCGGGGGECTRVSHRWERYNRDGGEEKEQSFVGVSFR